MDPTPARSRVHPCEAPRPGCSHAEQFVWEALRRELPVGWTAWHSLRIRDRKGFLGEGDFVLAHPERGLLVLEVKGGRIEERDGRWFSNAIPLDKPPLDQGHEFLGKLRRRLDEWGCEPPAWGVAVAFPETDFEGQPQQDDLRDVVLGGSHLRWLAQALPSVVERALPPPRAGRGRFIERLHQMWGETWVPSLSLGLRARQLGETRHALDDTQLAVLDGLLGNRRVLVEGGAGTGKTLLAAEAARRHAADGKRVLLLCFTEPLRKWLESRLAGVAEVRTVSGLARQIVERAEGHARPDEVTDSEYWAAVYERATDLCEARWDAVVVDEAQDFTFEAWMLVSELCENRVLWAFHDPGQSFWPDRRPLKDLFHVSFKLLWGRRCPSGIEALADLYLGRPADETRIRAAVAAGQLGTVRCRDRTQAPERIAEEIERLLSQGLQPGDIGIVSVRGQTAGDGILRLPRLGRHELVPADADGIEGRIVADTFLRWKGLERPAILVADVPEGGLDRLGTRMHIALTRALVAARVVACGGDPAAGWPGMGAEGAGPAP